MTIAPVSAIGVETAALPPPLPVSIAPVGGETFGSLLMQGLEGVNRQLIESNDLVRSFALDDSIPLHQVTFALEQSRLSFELLMQVRGRLVEGYQEMMRMQL